MAGSTHRFVRYAFWLAVWAVALLTSLSAQTLFEPFTLREDFHGDSLGQFSSYPPPQDYGYEPSITPTSDLAAPGGRAIMRVWKPNRDGRLRFGFIRPTYMQASNDGKFSFAFFLNEAGPADRIELGLAGSDGCRYQIFVPAKSGSWTSEQIRLTDFRCGGKAISPDVGIEAFYIVADLKSATADTTYRLLIDDLAVQARRSSSFAVREPQSVRIESQNAFVAAKSYNSGETVSISAAAPAKFVQVMANVENQDGKPMASQRLFDDGTHGDSAAGDGVWTNGTAYVVGQSDPPGVWKLKLLGRTEKGEKVETDVRFVHRAAGPLSHPRLYFGAKDRDALIARTRDPKASAIWQKIVADAEARRTGDIEQAGSVFEMLDTQYLLPSLLGYFDAMNSARLRIEPNALVAYLTGDTAARQSAKKALLDVSRWSRWEPPWFTAHGQHTYYPAGQMSAGVALAYDLLYDDLTEPERSLVRLALIEKAIVPVYKEYVLDNRVSANTSNWIAHTVGGALIASSAIAGDVKPDEANGQFDVYLNGLLLKFERHLKASYLPDGSYGEGISYKEFDLETTGPAMVALDRVFGIDYWSRTHVKDSTLYSLYTFAQPVEGSLDMGDLHPPSGRTLAPVVKYSKNSTDKWFYDQFAHSSIPDFLFFDDTVDPRPPDLPTSRIFDKKGYAVFRSDWGKDSIVFLFRAGPNFNHNHADQGSFLMTAFGEPLITEAGWSDYYKDPYYSTYFTQSAGHNTILVDRDPESQDWPDTRQFAALDSYPAITDSLTSEFFDGVGSRLESVYKGRMSGYTRRIVFVKPYYFVVFDDLKANGEPAKFDFLLHLPDRTKIKTESPTAVYSSDKASLAVRLFEPERAKLAIENGHIPYPVFATRTPPEPPSQPAYLDFATPDRSGASQFLLALAPEATEAAARNTIGQMSALTGESFKGIRTVRGNETDIVMFRSDAEAQMIRQGEWSADASVLAVTRSADDLKMFAAQNARTVKRGDEVLFSSDAAANIAVRYDSERINAVTTADSTLRFTLFIGRVPSRLLVDGKEVASGAFRFNRTANTITMTLASGRHEIEIESR